MKKLKYVIFLISLANLVFAQNSWNLIQTFSDELQCIVIKDSQNGFIGLYDSGSKILSTTNGGNTWEDLNIQGMNASIWKIIFVNNDFGIGVGSGGTTIISTNGGQTWVADNIGDTLDLRSITYNDGKLFACSIGSKIYKSVDNGINWIPIDTPAFILWDIAFATDSVGFGVGLYNTSIKTTDGGENWFSIPPIIQDRSMFSIKFINQNIGYVVGGSEITKTIDGGNNWIPKYNAGGEQLNDITIFGNNIAWVVGSDKILKTIDTGENWIQQTFSPYHYLLSANCIDSLVCYAIGGEGSLYKTTDGGGITSIEEDMPKLKNFQLYQNYPNPFNPTTTISFFLPKAEEVIITIFDINGRKIKIILNGKFGPGKHSIKFDAQRLASGIYYYRIKAGNFSDSKKFLYIK